MGQVEVCITAALIPSKAVICISWPNARFGWPRAVCIGEPGGRKPGNPVREIAMNKAKYFGAVLAMVFAFGGASYAQSKQAKAGNTGYVVGKQGFVTLKADTDFGKTILKPGNYIVYYDATDGAHVLTFWRMGDPMLALQYSDEALVGKPVSVPCKLERLGARAKHTEVITASSGAISRIEKVEIKGENVAHTFAADSGQQSE